MAKSSVKIYDPNNANKILGVVETEANGDITVRAWPGMQILGYYRAARDVTTDFIGRILTKGNTAVSLIYANK